MSHHDRQQIILDNSFLLGTAKPKDVVESSCKDFFRSFIFVCHCLFGILDHNIITSMIVLCPDLASPNLST